MCYTVIIPYIIIIIIIIIIMREGFILNICWVLHITSLFLIVKFPYKFRSLKKSTKLKYIHIGCVIAILVITALIPMVHAAGSNNSVKLGYIMISTISLFCLPKNSEVVFYTATLPSLLLVECGIALLLMTIWLIHKVIVMLQVDHEI